MKTPIENGIQRTAMSISHKARDEINKFVVFCRRRQFLRIAQCKIVFPASANKFIKRIAVDSMTLSAVLRDVRAVCCLLAVGIVKLVILDLLDFLL